MGLYELSGDESLKSGAPKQIDGVGALALSWFGHWKQDAYFVLLTAFIDESGMGEEPYLTMGGFLGGLGRLGEFSRKWQRHLGNAGIPYAHLTEMERGKPPFAGISNEHIRTFYEKAFPLTTECMLLGFTASICKNKFKHHYKSKFDNPSQGDSIFGLCARALIQFLVGYLDKHSDLDNPRLNIIYDHNAQFGNSMKEIFYQTKKFYDDGGKILGNFGYGETEDCHALQAADYLVARARRVESFALEKGLRKVMGGPTPPANFRKRAPIIHLPIEEDAFDLFIEEQAKIPILRSRAKWAEKKLSMLSD